MAGVGWVTDKDRPAALAKIQKDDPLQALRIGVFFAMENTPIIGGGIDSVGANPFLGPVSGRTTVVDPKGNAPTVEAGEQMTGSPDGRYLQVRDSGGNPTGLRIDGRHNPASHPDPRTQVPHAHAPGVTNSDGTPWLEIK
jgi:hypothetical protein